MKPPSVSIAALSVLLCVAAPSAGEVLERVIAKVNGDIVTLSEFEDRELAAIHTENIPPEGAAAFLKAKSGEILQEAIDDVLFTQKADGFGIRVRPEALDQVIAEIRKDNKIESDEGFRKQLAREGLTLDGLRRSIARSIAKRRVVAREIEPKATPSEAEVRADYDNHIGKYRRAPSARLQEIVLRSGANTATLATGLVTRARAGEDFGALAREYSVAPTAAAGGDLGWVALGELHGEVHDAIAGLKPGQTADPVAFGGSVRILKLNEKTEEHTVPYEEVREEIASRLREERMRQEYDRYVAAMREKAVIDVRVREVPHSLSAPEMGEPGRLRDTPLPPEGSLPSAPAEPEARPQP